MRVAVLVAVSVRPLGGGRRWIETHYLGRHSTMHLTLREEERIQLWAAAEMSAAAAGERHTPQLSGGGRRHLGRDSRAGARGRDPHAHRHDGIRRDHPEARACDGGRGGNAHHPAGGGLVPRRDEARHRHESRFATEASPLPAGALPWPQNGPVRLSLNRSCRPRPSMWASRRNAARSISPTDDIEINVGRRNDRARHDQHRRPPDPDRRALPHRRVQPGDGLRPRRRLRHAARHSERHGGSLRARPEPQGAADRLCRAPGRLRHEQHDQRHDALRHHPEQTMQRLRSHGYCFEGERYKVRVTPDTRFGKQSAKKS